jgi:hypothetical protein
MDELRSLTFPIVSVWLLHTLLVFFAVSLLAVFVGLGVHKNSVQRRERRHADIRARERDVIRAIAGEDGRGFASVSDLQHAFSIVDALHDCHITDIAEERRVYDVLAVTQIESLLRKAVRSKDWGLRFKSMTAIHDLGWPVFFNQLVEHAAHEENLRVKCSALYACSGVLDTPEQFLKLYDTTDAIEQLTTGFTESVFRTGLKRLGRYAAPGAIAGTLDTCLKRPLSPRLASLILSIGKEQLRTLAPVIVACARARPQRNIVISSMRALHMMGLSDPIIVGNLSSDDPVTQVAAIRCSPFCADAPDKLAGLMTSRSFDVRYAAAMTLLTFGAQGIELLHTVRTDFDDPYARNMAAFALAME